jgi:phage-related protein
VADGDVSLRYRLLGHDDASPAFNRAARSAEALHGTMSKVGTVLAGVAAGGVLALGAAMVQGVKDAESYQSLQLKSAAVLKSTGNVAGTSVKQIDGLAASLESMSGVDEELIINSQNVLLTFTKVRDAAGKGNDIFTQGTKAALNLSTALGTDLQASTIQVGKALNDPIKGVTALQRVGVSFTAAQKDQIAAMVKSGDTMGAQKLILGELSTEFGGAAKAAGGGFSGALARLKDVFGDAFRDLAMKYLPDLTRLANWLAAQIPGAIAAGVKAFQDLQGAVKAAGDVILPVFNFMRQHSTVVGSLTVAIVAMTVAWKTVTTVMAIWEATLVVAKAAQIAFIAVTQGQAAATRVATASQIGLNLAFLANPIGIVIVALVALAAGLVYAYKHSETFRNIVNAVWASVKGFVLDSIHGIILGWNKFKGAIDRVVKWFQDMQGKITGAFKDLPGKMTEIGHQSMAGLAKGIVDNAPMVLNPAAAIGGKIGDVISGALGIHSPSRVTMKIGENVMAGLEIGLRTKAPSVYAFLERFAQRIGDMKVTAGTKNILEKLVVNLADDMQRATGKLDKVKDQIKAQQAKVADLIKARNDYAAQLSSSVSSGGSIAGIQLAQDTTDEDGNTVKADQAGGFLASLKAKADAIKKFGSDMNKLRAEGLSQDVLQQIAQAGLDTGGALATALATATPDMIKSINGLSQKVKAESDTFGKTWAGQMYDSGIKAAEGIMKGLQSRESAIMATIRALANAMVAEIKATLKIKSPSGVMADEVGAMIPAGLIAGIQGGAGGVASAMASLVRVPQVGAVGVGLGQSIATGGVRGGDTHVHIHMQNGIVGDAAQVGTYLSEAIRRSGARGSALTFG